MARGVSSLSDEKRLEIGQAVLDGMRPRRAMEHFGVSKTVIYNALRYFEQQTGKKVIGPTTVEKSKMMKRTKGKANGHAPAATALATVAPDGNWQQRALEAEAREKELADRLAEAEDETHVLQKIVITLGRAL